jgi:hypothetical protein
MRLEISLPSELETLSQETEQLVSGSETKLPRRINFFYPSLVVLPDRLRVRSQPEDERRSHHTGKLPPRRDPAVKVALNFTFNFRSARAFG